MNAELDATRANEADPLKLVSGTRGREFESHRPDHFLFLTEDGVEKVRFSVALTAMLPLSVMRKKKCGALPASVLPRLRVMCGQDAALGPGRVQLLELIGETGSLRSAAARMGMAYMTAWMHVKALNRRFRSPLVVSKRGGKVGGGAVLTGMGQQVVAVYRRMEQASHTAIQEGFREFRTLLKR